MRHGFITIFILLFACIVNTAIAQQYIFKNYTVNDGLVANSIRRIFQDSKGFLWIATIEGLSKYDGHKFINFTTANGLSHNQVNDFYESKGGSIYIATNKEFINTISNGKIGSFHLPATTIPNRFFVAHNQKIIVTTDDNGLHELSNGKLVKPRQPFPASSYFDISPLNDSLFIAVSKNSIRIFNYQYEIFAEASTTTEIYADAKIFRDSKGRVFIGAYDGLKLLNVPAKKNEPLGFAPLPAAFNIPLLRRNLITGIIEAPGGIWWLGTSTGLVKINANGTHQLLTKKNGLIADNITELFLDSEKNIWIATSLGISKLGTRSEVSVYTTEDGLWVNSLYFVAPLKENHLLVGSARGLQVFNKQKNEFSSLLGNNSFTYYGVLLNTGTPILIANNKAAIIDTLTSQFYTTVQLPQNGIWIIATDKKGNFFYGSRQHLFSGTKKSDTMLSFRINNLLIDRKGYLWAGTWATGLYRIRYNYDGKGLHILSKEHYLPGKYIRSLFEDSNGNIWAGTRYHGVYRFTMNKESKPAIINIDQRNGLSSGWIKNIAEDANGNIWLAFYQGLDKLIPADTAYRVFNFSRVNNFYSSISNIVTDNDNSLWLATAEGMAHIKDGEMEKMNALPVYITIVSSPDSSYPVNINKLNLNYRHNQLQFEFSSPGFINEKQILYSYRLIGSTTDVWTQAANDHTVSYASLQPGEYTFEVRSYGWNGLWGEPARFEFTITPPFWQTWWFRVLAALLIAGLVFVLVRRRIKNIRHQAEMKHKLAETEMAALRAQMNPHFIFNCLNSIDNLIQTDQKEKATDYLAKFARLIRAILENSKSNTIPCWKDLEALQLYLQMEELRWDKKITCNMTIANEIQNGDYKVPPMIIQPFVENAIHHGLLNKITPDKKLSIDVKLEGTKIKYTITDNGVGRVKAGEYKKLNRTSPASFGIQITKDRINLFNQDSNSSVKITDLYSEQQQPEGTMAEVWLTTQHLTT